MDVDDHDDHDHEEEEDGDGINQRQTDFRRMRRVRGGGVWVLQTCFSSVFFYFMYLLKRAAGNQENKIVMGKN